MITRWIALYLVLVAGFVSAQGDNKPEIRGTVTESGMNVSVAGAEITLFESLPDADKTMVRTRIATTSSDTRGEFRFPLQHFGGYYLEAKKDSYFASTPGIPTEPPESASTLAFVDREHPSKEVELWLMRPGEVTGRLIDDEGNPVQGLGIAVQSGEPLALTDQEGTFSTRLPPRQYLLRVLPKGGEFPLAMSQFSEDDLKIVDRDFDPEARAPVQVSPGGTSSVGTIKVRRVPYYRAHVSVRGIDCEPREGWKFSAIPKAPPFTDRYLAIFPCADEFLIRNLKPGSYWFVLRSEDSGNGKWALADVEITRENVDVSLAMSQAAEINGRIIAAEGVTLPKFQKASIVMRARLGSLGGWAAAGPADSEGKFSMKNLPLLPHDVSVRGLGDQYYVKEIRLNGNATADGLATLATGASAQNLEIVLDDQPATITGSVRDGDKPVSSPFIVAVKWPFTQEDLLVSGDNLRGDPLGHFQISGLAPGEYRVMALSRFVRSAELSSELLLRGEKVTVERGSWRDLSLKPVDPSK